MGFLDDYEPVEDRLRQFWSDNPAGRVHTHLVKNEGGEYVIKAMIFRDFQSREPDATGYAQERDSQSGVNKTSALENCETSSIGRALANLGYAAKGKRPSREEMSKVSGRAADGEDVALPESTSAPRASRQVSEGEDSGGAEALASRGVPRVGADESPTGTPGDEGLVRQEATDPSSSGPVESPSNHLHGPWSEKRPDGAPMRDGWLRCEGCGQASLRKSVA